MKRFGRRRSAVVFAVSAVAVGAVLAGCTTPETGAGENDVIRVTWALNADPVVLAPFGVATNNYEGNEFMYESLLAWDKDQNIIPALAESYEVKDDVTYVFHLREGVTFHDGSELDAADVLYSLELQGAPPEPGNDGTQGQFPKPASVVAIDDLTVEITMPKPDPRILGYFAWSRYSAIVPEGIYDEIDMRTEGIGTGPFKLVEFVPNSHVTYEKYEDYWNPDVPKIDELVLQVMPDEQARVAALRSGQIQGALVSADTAASLENDAAVQIVSGLTANHREFHMTIKEGESKPWYDVRVRQAINHAMDRQAMIDTVYGGHGEYSSFIPAGFGEYALPDDELQEEYLSYDLELAKELMEEAGYADGFAAEMKVFNEGPDMLQLAQLIQQQLKEINIEITLVPMEVATFGADSIGGNYEFILTNRGMRGDPDGYLADYRPGDNIHEARFPGYETPQEISDLITEARDEVDLETRVELYHELQRMILSEAIELPLLNPEKFQAQSPDLQGKYVSFSGFNTALRFAELAK